MPTIASRHVVKQDRLRPCLTTNHGIDLFHLGHNIHFTHRRGMVLSRAAG